MSGSMNRVTLIGYLGADPEVRNTPSGKRVVSLSIATSEAWKDESGERRERTEWHRSTMWNDGLGKLAEQYLTKGAKVLIEGKLSTRKWQDQQGTDRYTTEIVLSPYNGLLTFLDTRRSGNSGGGGRSAPDTTSATASLGDTGHEFDDIPY
jgi:single-strand DNA-binding protein